MLKDLAFWGCERELVNEELDDVGELAAEDWVDPDEVEMTRDEFDFRGALPSMGWAASYSAGFLRRSKYFSRRVRSMRWK